MVTTDKKNSDSVTRRLNHQTAPVGNDTTKKFESLKYQNLMKDESEISTSPLNGLFDKYRFRKTKIPKIGKKYFDC